ncbi:MAG: hypothetical protein WAV82_08240, partial [Methylobacter sp.]
MTAIHQEEDNRLCLTLKRDNGERVMVYARHVVLAIHQSPLKKLLPFFPVPIGRVIEAVIPIPLMKCFFITKTPW